ncbi:MAG: alcohol dehydrogenase catalytic domain-containing protein [Mycobacterium sp.]
MRAVRSTPPGVTVVDVDVPGVPEDGELVAIRSAGICASDLKYIGFGCTNVLGHELAGTTRDGTPVAIEALFGCDGCTYCDAGQYNLCVHGPTPLGALTDGGMSEYFAAPARSLVALPTGLDVADACLIEPASVAWHACRLGGVGPDRRVAVVGGGAIGLLIVAAAQRMGAGEVSLQARHPHQRQVGERLGVTDARDVYDVVIEAAGSGSALGRCTELARPGATMVVLGVYGPDVVWPQYECFMKELRVVPSLGYCRQGDRRDFEDAADMLAQRPELAESLITHRFPIEDAAEAFRVASDRSSGALRVVLEP